MNTTVLYLIAPGSDPLAVMAVLRSVYGMSLSEARACVSSCPSELPAIDSSRAEDARQRLMRAEATVSTDAPGRSAEPKPTPAPEPAPAHDSRPDAAWDIPAPTPAPMPEEAPMPAQAPAPAADDPQVQITCYGAGEAKLQTVKMVKDTLRTNLATAKNMVDSWPATMTMPLSQATALKAGLAAMGLRAEIAGAGSRASATKADSASSDAGSGGCTISIPDPGPHRMQLIPLLKRELKMKYAQAATIAEKGGDITAPDPATAARICEALRSLDIYYRAR